MHKSGKTIYAATCDVVAQGSGSAKSRFYGCKALPFLAPWAGKYCRIVPFAGDCGRQNQSQVPPPPL